MAKYSPFMMFTPRHTSPNGEIFAIHDVRATSHLAQWRNIRHSRCSRHITPCPMAKYSPFTTFAPRPGAPIPKISAFTMFANPFRNSNAEKFGIHGVHHPAQELQCRKIRHLRCSRPRSGAPMPKYSAFTAFAPPLRSSNAEKFGIHGVHHLAQELQCRKFRHSRRTRPHPGAPSRSPSDLFDFSNIFVEIKTNRPILYDFSYTFMLMATLIVNCV